MNERDWLRGKNPVPMLDFLRGKGSDRKLRLFACACCRTIWHLLTDERSRRAVEVLELLADRAATDTELDVAAQNAHQAAEEGDSAGNPYAVWTAANSVGAGQVDEEDGVPGGRRVSDAASNAKDTVFSAAWAIGDHYHPDESGEAWYARTKAHEAIESDLLRDIIGNPYRPLAIDPSWRSPTVLVLTQAAYQERDLPSGHLDVGRLAVLADALEDAGCADAEILGHLRRPGPHVRGCFVLDLVLGRE